MGLLGKNEPDKKEQVKDENIVNEWLQKLHYRRGTRIIPGAEYEAKYKQYDIDNGGIIEIGDKFIPLRNITEHVFTVGRPGVGKSLHFYYVLKQLKEMKAKAVVYDFKGDYISKFYDPDTDLIFNPLDKRCLQWNLFNDIDKNDNENEKIFYINQIASSLVTENIDNQDRFWTTGALRVLRAVIKEANKNTKNFISLRNNKTIFTELTGDWVRIAEIVEEHEKGAKAFIAKPDSNQTMGIMAVLSQYTEALMYMQDVNGDFSIADWVEKKGDEKGGGFIFVSSYASIRDTIKPVLSLFIDLLIKEILGRKDNLDRRIYMFLDEIGTLQFLPSIVEGLTQGRSKGLSLWPAIQDIGQLKQIYGDNLTQTIVNACGTRVIFSMADYETAENFSNQIGEAEYLEELAGVSISKTSDASASIDRKIIKDKVVMASEIINLPKFKFILQAAGRDITTGYVPGGIYEEGPISFKPVD
ncbi:MAG: type IV secretion system DNA-binding domain-containing protein [Brevinematales bacterium]|nr:type IV secretion system DNA-binding domain-containing protein [Brevinematales bacterium]